MLAKWPCIPSCYGFPVSWVACKGFCSSRHSTLLWLMLLAPTLMHLSTLSKRTQIVKIVTSVFCSSAALQSLLRSWYLQRFPTCAISEGHTCTGSWSSMDLWSYHTSCVTLIQSFNYFRFCYLDWYLIKPWTWISWGKWKVPGPLKGQGLPVLPAAYRDWEDKWQNWCESAQNGAMSTVPVKVTEGESSMFP